MVPESDVIISWYGFSLPNEERGSCSDFVRSWELFRTFGPATKIDTHRSVARRPYDKARKREMHGSLMYPVVRFTGLHARAVTRGFESPGRRGASLFRMGSRTPSTAGWR